MIETKALITSTYEQETAVAPNVLVTAGTGANEVIEATGTSAVIIGVSDNIATDTADDEVGVIMSGIAMVKILAASSRGDAITGSTGGGGLATTTQNQYCVGYLLKATTVSNELAPVLVNPFLYPTVT